LDRVDAQFYQPITGLDRTDAELETSSSHAAMKLGLNKIQRRHVDTPRHSTMGSHLRRDMLSKSYQELVEPSNMHIRCWRWIGSPFFNYDQENS
jgi:hypothetical protein